jgi:hypothetical protein
MTIRRDIASQVYRCENRKMANRQERAPEDCGSNGIVIGQMSGLGCENSKSVVNEEDFLKILLRVFPIGRKAKIVVDQRRTCIGVETDTVAVHLSAEEGKAEKKHQKERPLIV